MNRYLRVWLIALVVSTLLFGQQIASFSSPQNRYYWTWSRLDAFVIVGLVLAFSTIGLGIYAAVHAIKKPWLSQIAGFAWVAVLALGVLSNIQPVVTLSTPWQYAWIATLLAIFVAAALLPRFRLVEWCAKLCLVFSLLPLILFGQVLSWKPWSSPKETYIPAPSKAGATPVFIFSFDALSWLYISDGDQIKPELPNLRKFSEQAYTFPNSISAASSTSDSLPMMAYQRDARFVVKGFDPRRKTLTAPTAFSVQTRYFPSQTQTSIFQRAEKLGYQTSLVTFYLPWRQILGDQCDYVNIYHEEPHGDGVTGRIVFTLLRNLRYYPYPGNLDVWRNLYKRLYSENWVRINRDIQREAYRIIDTGPASTMSFIHFPIPHGPFIFNANGSYRGPYRRGRLDGTLKDYLRSTQYADRVIGQLIDHLREAGEYDDALIIITSDHGWTPDKTTPNRIEILPRNLLLIKIPGQTEPVLIRDRIKNTSLGGIIQYAVQGKLDHTLTREQIAKGAIVPRAPTTRAGAQSDPPPVELPIRPED